MADRVIIDIHEGIADVRMNRPEKMNAVDPDMFTALREAGLSVAADNSIRAVVLSGEGRSFCAGLDVSSFAGMASSGPKDGGEAKSARPKNPMASFPDSPANYFQSCAWIWTEVPVPVIAAVHGVAFGAGIQIALGADIRIVAPDARMSVMEIKWGLIPDVAGTQTLKHLVRADVAKDLTFTGRQVSGIEAAELGLATYVSDTPRETALEKAAEIAAKSPSAIRAAKRLLNESRLLGPAEGLKLEAELQSGLMGKPNQVEAVKSNLAKRAPEFVDPE